MQHLSLQQKAALQYIKGPLLILGGAGCGKTSLLAHKIAWLIREHDVAPSAIVALAASASTVHRLHRRVAQALGHKVPDLALSTFAEFGLRAVQERPEAAGLPPGFSLYDRFESEALVARLLRETQPQAAGLAASVARYIVGWKRSGVAPPDCGGPPGSTGATAAARLYEAYHRRLRAANTIDLDDLAHKARERYLADAAHLATWRDRVRFLLLDEYEAASAAEHELVRLLAANGAILTAAGDDQQTREALDWGAGASLVRLPGDFPDLRVIRLDENFRSTRNIVALANRLAPSRRPARAVSEGHGLEVGAPVRVLRARSEQHEADTLVAVLLDCRLRAGADYSQHAILLRRAELAGPIEHALRTCRVPYYTRGISSFFGHTEVRDLSAYLRLLANPADDVAFLRAANTPRRDIDHATLERLASVAGERGEALLACALDPGLETMLGAEQLEPLRGFVRMIERLRDRAAQGDPGQAARALLADLRYEEWLRDTCNDDNIAARRMQNVARLIDMLDRLDPESPEAGLRSVTARLNLEAVRDPEADEGAVDGVALMTLAAANGMEFAHVYLVGFEQAPGAREPGDEQRQAYIGVSRARAGVVFTVAERRRAAGNAARQPSRFLRELSAEVEWVDADPAPGLVEHALARGGPRLDGRPAPSG